MLSEYQCYSQTPTKYQSECLEELWAVCEPAYSLFKPEGQENAGTQRTWLGKMQSVALSHLLTDF